MRHEIQTRTNNSFFPGKALPGVLAAVQKKGLRQVNGFGLKVSCYPCLAVVRQLRIP